MEGNNYSPTTCSKCGETLNDDQRFCPSCGVDIDAYKNRSCAKCGAAIADGQTFCTECGAKYLDPNSKTAKAKNWQENSHRAAYSVGTLLMCDKEVVEV